MSAERATVHDSISCEGHVWSVTGVFHGGMAQESVLGLQVTGNRMDATAYGADVPELFVPEIIIRRAIEAGVIQLHKPPDGNPVKPSPQGDRHAD